MEVLRLTTAYCSDDKRNDLSQTISNVVAVIVTRMPSDVVILGRIFPYSRVHANDESYAWWLLGYSLKYHMVFAQVVSCKHSSHILSKSTILRTVKGAKCTFEVDEWRASVITDKYFHELDADSLTDEAIVASFMSYPPERFTRELGYSKFHLQKKNKFRLPYVTDWIELHILSDVDYIEIPNGVKHLTITTCLSEPYIHLPESIVSCYIHKEISVRLSIPNRFSKHWGYWSALWGKTYNLSAGFKSSPDGLVSVRP